MFNFIVKRYRREAMQQLVNELFTQNAKDGCWDSIGSVDYNGMIKIIETIAAGKLLPARATEAKSIFKKHLKRFKRFQEASQSS